MGLGSEAAESAASAREGRVPPTAPARAGLGAGREPPSGRARTPWPPRIPAHCPRIPPPPPAPPLGQEVRIVFVVFFSFFLSPFGLKFLQSTISGLGLICCVRCQALGCDTWTRWQPNWAPLTDVCVSGQEDAQPRLSAAAVCRLEPDGENNTSLFRSVVCCGTSETRGGLIPRAAGGRGM